MEQALASRRVRHPTQTEHSSPRLRSCRKTLSILAGACVASLVGCGPPAGSIHRAAIEGDVKAIERILTATPEKLNERDRINFTALDHAVSNKHWNVVKTLVSRGAEVRRRDDISPRTALHAAAREDKKGSGVIALLVEAGADVDALDTSQGGPLHVAVRAGNLGGVLTLLEHHATIDLRDHRGCTPLRLAATRCYGDIAQVLLRNGADPNTVDNEGMRPLHFAANVGPDSARIGTMLLAAGADVNAADRSGMTALHRAASYWHLDVTRLLIDAGGDVNATDSRKYTPLHYAAGVRKDMMSQALAAIAQPVAVVELLLAHGAATDVTNIDAKTPLDLAADSGNSGIARALEQTAEKQQLRLRR